MGGDRGRLPESERMDSWLGLARAATVGQLVPGAAHELNNSLTTILGHVQVLLGRPDLPENLRDRLQLLAAEGARAGRLLHAMLAVSRVSTVERRPCSLADHAQRVLDLTRHGLHQVGVRVVTEFDSCPVVRMDEQDLQQIILALVQRAREAMRGQGEDLVLTVRTGPTPDGARLEVLDTGRGDDGVLPARLADALALGSIGAGLLLARHLAAVEGGRLHGAGRPEGGMIFTLDLPAAAGRE